MTTEENGGVLRKKLEPFMGCSAEDDYGCIENICQIYRKSSINARCVNGLEQLFKHRGLQDLSTSVKDLVASFSIIC